MDWNKYTLFTTVNKSIFERSGKSQNKGIHTFHTIYHYYNRHKRIVYFVNIIKIGRLNLSVSDYVLVFERVDESLRVPMAWYMMVLILTNTFFVWVEILRLRPLCFSLLYTHKEKPIIKCKVDMVTWGKRKSQSETKIYEQSYLL